MGFFGSVVSWVGKTAEDAWDGVKDAADWVEDTAEEVRQETENAADWVETTAEVVWDWSKDEGVRIGDGAVSLYEGVTEGGKALLSDFGEGSAHISMGLFKIIQGDFADGAKEIGGGAAQATVGAVFDGGALILSGAVSTVQVIGHIEEVSRPLDADEIEVLRGIYGNAVDLSDVRIKEGSAGLLTATDRPWTSGDTIYMNMDRSDPRWIQTLVHEMGHVWQFQNGGPDYQSKSIAAQYVTKDAYQWESAALEEKPWESLNPEDQAQLIEQMFAKGFFTTGEFKFTASDGTVVDRTAYAEQVMDQIRRGLGAP
jgi:hypothetical protein